MTATTSIPLNKLLAWEGNVRKTDPEKGIDELAASISAHGLLQSLVVRPGTKGRHAVVAGRRRFEALRSLARSGAITSDHAVPCLVIGKGADATEISLAENAVREQMHPADEFEAFRLLVDGGLPAADVAARFGVTETVVRKRLRLARVSPAILEAFRSGDLSLEQVMAFAISDDHAAQEYVLENLSGWNGDPSEIRAALTADEIAASDRRVRFVTLEAYAEAGGSFRRDLFADGDEDGVFILDPALLDSLFMKKLEEAAESIRAEGWKWVEIRASYDYSEWSKCERRYPQAAELSPELQQELDALTAEQDRLVEIDDDDGAGADEQRLDEITSRIHEIEDREKHWTPETLAIAGAVVSVDYAGEPAIHRGYVRPEDRPAKRRGAKDAGHAGGSAGKPMPALPAALTESLTLHRTAAMAAELMNRPDIALAALVHTLAAQLFLNECAGDTCLQLSVTAQSFRGVETAPASEALRAAREAWFERLPGNADALWEWCMSQEQTVLLDLLAFCVADSVNAVRKKADREDAPRLAHADLLARSLSLDMTKWFTPTAENYFGRITKDAILRDLQEAKGTTAPAWSKTKKGDLAEIAEREVAGSGWLPTVFRVSSLSE